MSKALQGQNISELLPSATCVALALQSAQYLVEISSRGNVSTEAVSMRKKYIRVYGVYNLYIYIYYLNNVNIHTTKKISWKPKNII